MDKSRSFQSNEFTGLLVMNVADPKGRPRQVIQAGHNLLQVSSSVRDIIGRRAEEAAAEDRFDAPDGRRCRMHRQRQQYRVEHVLPHRSQHFGRLVPQWRLLFC